MPDPSTDMLELRGVVKHYRTRGRGVVHAMDGVDLTVPRGSILGLVGESGCGKSTTARLLTGLETPTSGVVRIDGRDAAARGRSAERGPGSLHRTVQMVFQDPYASLDPRQRIGDALAEVLTVHRLTDGKAATRARVTDLLELVGLLPSVAERYPHQLSGGQRQRVGIARALAVEPAVLVLDEPVSALDVSVRAEIINLLVRLRDELDLTYVFISHDLAVVRHLCDEVAVMYLGQIVEQGRWEDVCDRAVHPYTQALQAAVPTADPAREAGRVGEAVRGEVPDAARPPAGCRFHPRCPLAEDVCRTTVPVLSSPGVAVPVGPGGEDPQRHRFACHVRRRELAPAGGVPT